MKYVYKKIYAKIPRHAGMEMATAAITKAMMGDPSDLQDINQNECIDVFVGGTFYPPSGRLEDVDLMLTDFDVIYRNRDYTRALVNSMACMFGNPQLKDAEYIGIWSDDVDENAYVYYLIDGNTIRKFIMTKMNDLTFTNMNGASDIQFIVNIDGKMNDCMLEEGDILFTDYDEAMQYVMDNKDKYKKETQDNDKGRIQTMVNS